MAFDVVQTESFVESGSQNPVIFPTIAPSEGNEYYLFVSYQDGSIVNSITQTNVTWTLQSTTAPTFDRYGVRVFRGTSSGAPGNSFTVNFDTPTESIVSFTEISNATGLLVAVSEIGTASTVDDLIGIGASDPHIVLSNITYVKDSGQLVLFVGGGFTQIDSNEDLLFNQATVLINRKLAAGDPSPQAPSVLFDNPVEYAMVSLSIVGQSIVDLAGTAAITAGASGALLLECPPFFPIKTDYKEEGQDNFIGVFEDATSLKNLLCTYLNQVQDLENVLHATLNSFNLKCASGDQLDTLGSIVDEERQGQSDDLYRIAIQTKIRANVSTGTVEDIIEIAQIALNNAGTVKITEAFPLTAFVEVLATDLDLIRGSQLKKFLVLGSPAGVQLFYIFIPDGAFRFDTPGLGFDQGIFASLL